MTDALIHPGKNVCLALNKAFNEWKSTCPLDGKKYIYFENHCEALYGCNFVYNYTDRTFHSWRITNEQKYLLFLLKYQ